MKKIRISLLAFFDNSGQVLLNHRRDGLNSHEDIWEIIGGGIKENEEPLDAIKREIAEELHYALGEDVVFVERFEITNDKFFAEVHFFKAEFPGFHKFSDSDEVLVSDLKLFSLREALGLPLLPICKHILQKISNK